MKRLITLLLLASSSIFANTIPLYMSQVHVPFGFDGNDNTEIYVTGSLPGLCYQGPYFNSKVVGRRIYVEVYAKNVWEQQPGDLPPFNVPYEMKVELGQLQPGAYQVILNARTRFQQVRNIEVAVPRSARADDYIYAIVKDVTYKNGIINVEVENPSPCFKKADAVVVPNKYGDTIAILPKLRLVQENCPQVPQKDTYKIPYDLNTKAETLIHVRSIGGKSFNKIVKE